MVHAHRLRGVELPVTMRARTTGVLLDQPTRSAYYMIKVLLAIFVGLLRARPAVQPATTRPWPRSTRSDGRCASRSSPCSCTGGLFLLVFELVRRRRLMERYALLWLFATAMLLGLAIWRGLLEASPRRRHRLRAVRAVRGRVRLRPGAAAALLARDLAAQRPEQGARAARWACCNSRSTTLEAGGDAERDREPSRHARSRSRADVDAGSARSPRSWSSPRQRRATSPATLEALRPQLRPDDELVIVDNALARRHPERRPRRAPQATVVERGRTSASPVAARGGARGTSPQLVLFLNPDAVPAPGASTPCAPRRRAPGLGRVAGACDDRRR